MILAIKANMAILKQVNEIIEKYFAIDIFRERLILNKLGSEINNAKTIIVYLISELIHFLYVMPVLNILTNWTTSKPNIGNNRNKNMFTFPTEIAHIAHMVKVGNDTTEIIMKPYLLS